MRRLPADDQRRAAAGIINIDADAGFNIPGGIGGHPAPFGAVDVHNQGLGLRHIVGVVGHRAVGILEQQTGTAADDVYHAAVALRQRSRSTDTRAVMGVDCRVIQMDTGNFSLVFNAVAGTNRIHVDGGIFDRKSCSAVIQQDTVRRPGSMGNAATGQIERRAIRQPECGPTIGCGNHPGVVDRRIRAENIDGGTIHANRRGIIQRPAVDQYTRAVRRRQIDSPAVVQRTAGQYLVAQGPDSDVIPVQYRGAVQNGCASSAFFADDRRRAATDDPCRRAVLRKANIGTGVNCRFRAAFHAQRRRILAIHTQRHTGRIDVAGHRILVISAGRQQNGAAGAGRRQIAASRGIGGPAGNAIERGAIRADALHAVAVSNRRIGAMDDITRLVNPADEINVTAINGSHTALFHIHANRAVSGQINVPGERGFRPLPL